MSMFASARFLRNAILGLFLAPLTAIGAVTSLTALPQTVTMYGLVPGGSARTNSAPVVLAGGSGTASLTISAAVTDGSGNWLTAFLSNSSINAGSSVGVTISVDPKKLSSQASGFTYNGQVTVSTGTVSAVFHVKLIVQGGSDIQLTPPSQNVSLQVGGSVTFGVGFMAEQPAGTSTAPGKKDFPLNLPMCSTVDGNNWLSASQTSNFTFSVTVSAGGLAAGFFSGGCLISGNGQGPFQTNFAVGLTVGGGSSSQSGVDQTSLTFNLSAGAQPSQQTINVSAGASTFFSATAATTTGGNWLQATPASGSTPAAVTVTATPGSLAPGNYTGNIQFGIGSGMVNVPVSLTLTATASLQAGPASIALTAQPGGSCTPQTASIQSSDSTLTLPFTVKTPITTPVSGAWLTASPSSGATPANLSVSCNTAGLLPGNYSGTVIVSSAAATNATAAIPVTLSFATQPTSNTQTISHIADGQGWKTTAILVNSDTVPALYTVNFWNEAGASYSPPLGLGATSGTIPVGGSATIQTADADPKNLTEGWAQVTSSQSIGGTAIFRADSSGQEAAVPLLTSGGTSLQIPYQVGNGQTLGVALANPSATQTASITEVIRGQNGNQLSSRTLTLPAQNHVAFNPPALNSLTGSGVAEYDSNVNIYALGIRGNNGAFTSLDAVLPQPANTKTSSRIADGQGWKSTIILVNTDTVAAAYTVNFWNEAGAAYSPPLATGATSGTIPVGGSAIIQTADTDPKNLTEGWAQVTSSQSIGGTAIFRLDSSGQEAAVPLLTSGGASLQIPYQVGNGLTLGVALANPSATQSASITEVTRDQFGNQLSSRTLTLPAHSHVAFNPPALNGLTGSGVVEYDANVSIYALGIRGNNGAFTSLRAVYK
jgi:hypothetical protein